MAVVVAAAGGGWVAGGSVRSPAEAAAARKPPTPSPVTVPVEKRALSDDLTRRGSVRFDQATPLSLAGSVGGDTGGPQVVTRAPTAGSELIDGSVVLEVNGRPVFVLEGDQPNYRALTPGAKGRDVEQFEAALQRLGFDPGPRDSLYDAATQAAVRAFYESKGYTAQGPSAQDLTTLRDARKAVVDADERLRDAGNALAAAGKGAAGSELLERQNEVRSSAQGVETAKAEAARNNAEAAATIAARAAELDAAKAAGAQALAAQADAVRTGRDPADPAKTCDALCAARLQADVDTRNGAVSAASAALDAARATAAVTAQRASADVARAEDQLVLSQTRLAEAQAPKDTASASKGLDAARQAASQAAADLAQLEARTGTSVPAGELLFLRDLPRRVDSVKAKVGEAVTAEFVSVSGTDLAVDSSVDAADAANVEVGMKVTMRLPEVDRTLTGTVAALADKPGTNNVGNGQVYVRIAPDDVADAAQLNGLGVVVTIPLRATDGEVLTVPIAALSTRADGTSWLSVAEADGTRRDVQVEIGLQGPGAVEVEPVGGGRLAAGDRVVVSEQGDTSDDSDEGEGSGA